MFRDESVKNGLEPVVVDGFMDCPCLSLVGGFPMGEEPGSDGRCHGLFAVVSAWLELDSFDNGFLGPPG